MRSSWRDTGVCAAAGAEQQVASVRDGPAGRIILMERCYYGPFGQAPQASPVPPGSNVVHALADRAGGLQPPFSARPGSPWRPTVN